MMALITLPSMLAAVGAQSAIDVYDVTLSEPGQLTPEITTNDLRRALESGGQLVVDARTAFEFALGHIPTAVNPAPKPGVPMSQYVSDASEIGRLVGHDRNSAIIIYCNGPFCGKSRRLGEELVRQGFTNVRRYQLGASMWRTLVGPMEIEPAGISYVLRNDRTAVCIDARTADEYAEGTVAGARNVSVGELIQAKDDGRLPMDDFNTRVVVCGRDRAQALQMARALVGQGFGNVKYYADTFSRLIGALR